MATPTGCVALQTSEILEAFRSAGRKRRVRKGNALDPRSDLAQSNMRPGCHELHPQIEVPAIGGFFAVLHLCPLNAILDPFTMRPRSRIKIQTKPLCASVAANRSSVVHLKAACPLKVVLFSEKLYNWFFHKRCRPTDRLKRGTPLESSSNIRKIEFLPSLPA